MHEDSVYRRRRPSSTPPAGAGGDQQRPGDGNADRAEPLKPKHEPMPAFNHNMVGDEIVEPWPDEFKSQSAAAPAGKSEKSYQRRLHGRAFRFNAVAREAYLERVRAGERPVIAARGVGLDWRFVSRYAWENPDFARHISDAELEAHKLIEAALFKNARSGSATAIDFGLANWTPELWSEWRRFKASVPPWEFRGEEWFDLEAALAEAFRRCNEVDRRAADDSRD